MLSIETKAADQLTGNHTKVNFEKRLIKRTDLNCSLVSFCPEANIIIVTNK